MEYVEFGSLSSYLRLHEDELMEETNQLLKYSLDIAQVINDLYYLQTYTSYYILNYIPILNFVQYYFRVWNI